mgnify:CR=1 FL=1
MSLCTRATVSICAHYVPGRIPFLSLVLDSILTWKMEHVRVVVISNDPVIGSEDALIAAMGRYSERGWHIEVELATNLEHPYLLPWRQVRILREWIKSSRDADDYYIYIEDDMILNWDNIEYYTKLLMPLRAHGLIPGFLRYEVCDGARNSVDLTEPQLVSIYPTVTIADAKFVCPVNPYWAGFIFDRALANEYLGSSSCDMFESQSVMNWGIRERAAMGLTWEAVPGRHKSRCVIPLVDGRPAEYCHIWHCAQNYNVMPESKHARIPLSRVFLKGDILTLLMHAGRKLANVFGAR